jgi:CHAD domain-containing protein
MEMKAVTRKKKDVKKIAIKVLKKPEMREFLKRFYRKRVASFLVNLYKAGITSDMKDIHRSRLDVKRLFALFQFFEVADNNAFVKRKHEARFIELFRRSGKIREIQVGLLTLERFINDSPFLHGFKKFMTNEEKRQTEKLISVIRKFDERSLKKTDQAVIKAISQINPAKMVVESNRFLLTELNKILGFSKKMDEPKNVHSIRKELKSMSTICTLLLSMQQDESLDRIVSVLNQTEMTIGEWHDNRVLMDFFESYIKRSEILPDEVLTGIDSIRNQLAEENSKLIEKLVPGIYKLVSELNPELKPDLNINIRQGSDKGTIKDVPL